MDRTEGLAAALPAPVLGALSGLRDGWRQRDLRALRARMFASPPKTTGTEMVDGLVIELNDPANFYIQYKDEFVHGVYDATFRRPDPRVIDGGANIGMSVLRLRSRVPGARVTAFEPDPRIADILHGNLARNGYADVEIVRAALGSAVGTASFAPDGTAGGQIVPSGGEYEVNVAALSRWLDEPVDLVKLNIEGAELDVLEEVESADRIRNVDQWIIEYHGWPTGPQRLGPLVDLLARNGFRYLVHDYDQETNGTSKPPFRWREMPYFLLVYAQRMT